MVLRDTVNMVEEGIYHTFTPAHAMFDLVLIHGLHGHALRSWNSARDSLPFDLAATPFRLLTYQYAATSETFKGLSSLTREADKLIAALRIVRTSRENLERPILWLCHDLGGILLKQALLHHSWVEENDPASYPAATWLSKSTYAILFFGTPQLACDKLDDFPDRLNRLYRLTTPTTHKQKLSGSASLPLAQTIASVNKSFEPYFLRYKICFIHATLRSYALGRSDFIFPESVTCPRIPGTTRLGVLAEHCDMIKFPSQNDSYFAIVEVLRQYALNACTVISKRWERPISMRAALLSTDLRSGPEITDSRSLSPQALQGLSQAFQTLQTGRPPRNQAPISSGQPAPLLFVRARAQTVPQGSASRFTVSRNEFISRMHDRMSDSSDDLIAEEEIDMGLSCMSRTML